MIRVFIVADSAVMQMGLETIVESDEALTVVGRSNAIPTQLAAFETSEVEVLLLSLDLTPTALNLVASLLDSEPSVAVVWLIDLLSEPEMAKALKLGVLGILPQEATATEITAAIQATAAGLISLHSEFVSLIRSPVDSSDSLPAAAPLSALTQREIEILQMLAAGMANKTIAKTLLISEHTVKFHVSSIFTKLGVSSRTEAVTLGIRQGIILL